jgi:lipopolysaccharide export system permease protein
MNLSDNFGVMKKLDVYIAKQIWVGFLLVALSLMSMLWLTQSLKFVEMVTDKGLPVYLFIEMTSLLMPRVFTVLSPIALFVAVMFVYNRLITDSELIVMKAVGINSFMIARAAIMVGFVMAVFNVFVLNYGIPVAEKKFRDLEYEVKNSFTKMMLREGTFTSFKNNMTVFIDKFEEDGSVRGILVSDGKKKSEKVITVAEKGMIEYTDVGPKILLKNGTRQVMNKKSQQFSSMRFDDYVVDFGDVSKANKKKESVREKGIKELFEDANNPKIQEKDRRAFRAEAHRRILAPIFNLIFAMLACCGLLVANFNRRGQGKVITISILVMIAIQALDMGFSNMARKSEWIIILMYLNCFVPLIAISWLLIKTPSFRRKKLKLESSNEI